MLWIQTIEKLYLSFSRWQINPAFVFAQSRFGSAQRNDKSHGRICRKV